MVTINHSETVNSSDQRNGQGSIRVFSQVRPPSRKEFPIRKATTPGQKSQHGLTNTAPPSSRDVFALMLEVAWQTVLRADCTPTASNFANAKPRSPNKLSISFGSRPAA